MVDIGIFLVLMSAVNAAACVVLARFFWLGRIDPRLRAIGRGISGLGLAFGWLVVAGIAVHLPFGLGWLDMQWRAMVFRGIAAVSLWSIVWELRIRNGKRP